MTLERHYDGDKTVTVRLGVPLLMPYDILSTRCLVCRVPMGWRLKSVTGTAQLSCTHLARCRAGTAPRHFIPGSRPAQSRPARAKQRATRKPVDANDHGFQQRRSGETIPASPLGTEQSSRCCPAHLIASCHRAAGPFCAALPQPASSACR